MTQQEQRALGLRESWPWEGTRKLARKMFSGLLRHQGHIHFSGTPWEQESGPFIFAPTHASHLDFWAVLEGLPDGLRERTYVAAAQDYFYANFLRRWTVRLISYHNFSYNRQTVSPEEYYRLIAILKAGYSLLIFPQGTRGRGQGLPAFKPFAARLAIETNVPLVPVGLRGTGESLPPGQWWPRWRPIQVAFGQPLRPEKKTGPALRQARDLTARLQAQAEQLLHQLKKDDRHD